MQKNSVNKVILVGNLGQDPEGRFTPQGTAVTNLSVATNESWKNQNGELQDRTEWHRVVIFSEGLVKVVEQYVKKGSKVKVLIGKDRSKQGEVIEIDRKNNRAKVKEVNMVKKHVKTTKEKKGGIVSKENFLHISNLALIDEKKIKQKEVKK